MRKYSVSALIVCLVLFLAVTAYAYERCMMCGMNAGNSETKFTVEVTEGGKDLTAGTYSFCCLNCLVLFKTRMRTGKIGSVLARDYDTVTGQYDSGQMIDAKTAFYIVESELRPKGSMPPMMSIFSAQKKAEISKKVYGGRILNWEEVREYTERWQ